MGAVRTQPGDLRRIGAGLAHLRLDLLGRVAERKRLRLGEAILQGEILCFRAAPRAAQRRNEIERRRWRPLVQHLKE